MLSIIRHRPHTGQNNTCLPRDMYVDETQDTHAQHRHTGKTHRWHVDTVGPSSGTSTPACRMSPSASFRRPVFSFPFHVLTPPVGVPNLKPEATWERH